MVGEGDCFFPININSYYYVLQKKTNKIIVSLRTIVNGNVNIICYDSKDVVPPCLSYISHNNYNNLSPLHNSTEENDRLMDKKNQIESIEFERSFSIGTKDYTYYYNDEFWYST